MPEGGYKLIDVRVTPIIKEFLGEIGPGIQVKTTCSYLADEVCARQVSDSYAYDEYEDLDFMRKYLTHSAPNALGETRHWFSPEKFERQLREKPKEVGLLLLNLGNYDHELYDCYDEACVEKDELSEEVKHLCELVESEEILSFHQLLYESREKRVARRWKIVKAAFSFLVLHSSAVKTANHPDRKRSRGEFEL